jgi:hypothetical protein
MRDNHLAAEGRASTPPIDTTDNVGEHRQYQDPHHCSSPLPSRIEHYALTVLRTWILIFYGIYIRAG